MNPRIARVVAWSVVGLYILLATVGLSLQYLSYTSYTQLGIPLLVVMVLLAGSWPVIGALIISRHPRHPVGWLLSIGVFAAAVDNFAAGYVSYDALTSPGALPGLTLALIWLNWSGLPFSTAAFTLMILLFPDGRLPSPRLRAAGWTSVGALLVYLVLHALQPGPVDPLSSAVRHNPVGVGPSIWVWLRPLLWLSTTLLVLCYAVALASLFHRLRHAWGDYRQQVKWLLYPATLYGISVPLLYVGELTFSVPALQAGILLGLPAIAGIVIATAVAIFKYRLYDIDILVNRTMVYGALSAIVVGLYVLIVGALGTLFQSQGNLWVALVATGLVAVLFQPLRERVQRAVNRLTYGERDEPFDALARLGRRLEGIFAPEMVSAAIVETVAQTLKLPYVAIAVERGQRYEITESYGVAEDEPVAYPLTHHGQVVGELRVGARGPGETFGAADERLLRNFARQAGAAVHAVQLMTDLQRSRQQLVTAREEERLRLRRDLHDGLGPTLASVMWQVDSARALVNREPTEALRLLESAIEQAGSGLSSLRQLVYGLRPPALDELGLVGALEQTLRRHQQSAVTIDAPAPLPPLPAAAEVAAYRIVQEAVKNAIEHGMARNCAVRLEVDGSLNLAIEDDGTGLPEVVRPGVGLLSMRERAEELGGTLTVQSGAGGGTKVRACLPLE